MHRRLACGQGQPAPSECIHTPKTFVNTLRPISPFDVSAQGHRHAFWHWRHLRERHLAKGRLTRSSNVSHRQKEYRRRPSMKVPTNKMRSLVIARPVGAHSPWPWAKTSTKDAAEAFPGLIQGDISRLINNPREVSRHIRERFEARNVGPKTTRQLNHPPPSKPAPPVPTCAEINQ